MVSLVRPGREDALGAAAGRLGIPAVRVEARGRLSPSALGPLVRLARGGLLHAHDYKSLVLALAAGALARAPVVATFHGDTAHMKKVVLYERLARWAARFTSAVAATSGPLADRIRAAAPRTPVHVIPNGIPVGPLPHAPPSVPPRARRCVFPPTPPAGGLRRQALPGEGPRGAPSRGPRHRHPHPRRRGGTAAGGARGRGGPGAGALPGLPFRRPSSARGRGRARASVAHRGLADGGARGHGRRASGGGERGGVAAGGPRRGSGPARAARRRPGAPARAGAAVPSPTSAPPWRPRRGDGSSPATPRRRWRGATGSCSISRRWTARGAGPVPRCSTPGRAPPAGRRCAASRTPAPRARRRR